MQSVFFIQYYSCLWMTHTTIIIINVFLHTHHGIYTVYPPRNLRCTYLSPNRNNVLCYNIRQLALLHLVMKLLDYLAMT